MEISTGSCICRHIGVRVKGVLIAAIYNKALSVDLSASKESVGKLNNLISVDVSVSSLHCIFWLVLRSTKLQITLLMLRTYKSFAATRI